ncbi:MAG: sugar-binding transcriptional regulator [Lachnospiraceae bacterium]|nr:sugar-binding transcriptional regulator [Lachnospiraceae bacterium]
MKKVVDDVRLMIKVCDLYYNQNLGQAKIAEELRISRPTVSRLLSTAREQEIVKITVSDLDTIRYWELERRLKEMYHLKDAMIVDSKATGEELKESLGWAAGRYLEYNIKDGYTVGVSMGSTLYQVVSHITQPQAKNVTFVPLIGGLGQLRMELHSNNLAESLSRIYEGSFVPLYAPARVSSAAVRAEFMREESMAAALGLESRLDMAIVGIGYPNEQSSIKATGYFEENEMESLIERKVAGEICMQFYDESGDAAPYRNDNNVIGMELNKLRKVPCSIGIAGGIEKLKALKGAMQGHYINILITDFQCAQALIQGGKFYE